LTWQPEKSRSRSDDVVIRRFWKQRVWRLENLAEALALGQSATWRLKRGEGPP
jgi:hypothetical protein